MYQRVLKISTNREVNNFTPKPELEEKGKGALCGVVTALGTYGLHNGHFRILGNIT